MKALDHFKLSKLKDKRIKESKKIYKQAQRGKWQTTCFKSHAKPRCIAQTILVQIQEALIEFHQLSSDWVYLYGYKECKLKWSVISVIHFMWNKKFHTHTHKQKRERYPNRYKRNFLVHVAVISQPTYFSHIAFVHRVSDFASG